MITAEELRAIVDYDPLLGTFYWKRSTKQIKAGDRADCCSRGGYRGLGISGKLYTAHRMAWLHYYGRHPNGIVDHWNGTPHDNRICNLREATPQQNSWNSKQTIRATFVRPGVWTASFMKGGERIKLGKFSSEEEALEAKRKAMEIHLGEFGFHNRDRAPAPISCDLMNPPVGSELFGSGI